jgi:drug/metabolite transporter (DMT)-like permease
MLSTSSPENSPVRSRGWVQHRFAGLAGVGIAILGLSWNTTLVKSIGAPATVVAFWRMLFATVGWHGFLLVKGKSPTRTQWRAGIAPGLLFTLNLLFFFNGTIRTAVAHAEFIGALTPLLVIPAAAMVFHERVPKAVLWLGLIALSGLALIIFVGRSSKGVSLLGDALIGCAICTWSAYLLVTKSVRATMGTAPFMAVLTSICCLTVSPLAIASGKLFSLSTKGWVLVTVMSISAGIVCHGLIAWAQTRVPVGVITLLQLAQPVLGTLIGFLVLHEKVRPLQIVGMAVVITAVAAVARVTARRSVEVPNLNGPNDPNGPNGLNDPNGLNGSGAPVRHGA